VAVLFKGGIAIAGVDSLLGKPDNLGRDVDGLNAELKVRPGRTNSPNNRIDFGTFAASYDRDLERRAEGFLLN